MARLSNRSHRTCVADRCWSGFVLLEALLAVGVLIISAVWLMAAYHSALHLTEVAQQTLLALDDLKDMMERIKATSFSQLNTNFPNGAVNGVVGPGPDKYGAVVGGYGLTNEQITVVHQPSTGADPKELVVQLSWTNRGRTYQTTISTVRASKAS